MILIAIPHIDFDPNEVSVPRKVLTNAGHDVVFATPSGKKGSADYRMVSGRGFGLFRGFLAAQTNSRLLYKELQKDSALSHPISYDQIKEKKPHRGFSVKDGNYISARWPGDAYCFAYGFLDILDRYKQ